MTRRLQPYQPTARDVAWAREMVRILKDGARIQTSLGRYRIDKQRKELILEEPAEPWNNLLLLAMHHRHTYVWRKLGYEVLPKVDFDNDPKFELPDAPGKEDQS